MKPVALLLSAVLLLASSAAALAQAYPAKPVRMIVPFAAGGSVDIVGRTMAQALTEALGQSFFVENRPGVGGLLAMDAVASTAPDGYTLGVGSAGPLTVAPAIHRDRGFQPLAQLEAIVLFASAPGAILARHDLPAANARELIALSKGAPGKLTMASAGSGSVLHLIGEYFQERNDIRWTHIPYKGSGPALVDLVAGRVDVMIDTPPSAAPHVKSGRIKVIALTSRARSSLLPEVSTLAEQGFPGYDMGSWMGLVAPKGTPRAVITQLNAALVKALKNPEVQQRLASLGAEPDGGTPEQFAEKIKVELARWTEVIERTGIKAN
ncbi:MAG TPA: tripartite tricarboxylate transporter substrate binding protein [Burkholderiales bacterium]|nr:tripartite tricarboxylate transporter substrate binding protein [Burkholderiales bacterium]